ncbi:hypothetical protein OK016_29755 [Vibrio chagasii]|nr:hypothetical protein [Vibrio chagasii]
MGSSSTDVGYKGADEGKVEKYLLAPPGYDNNEFGTKQELESQGYLVFETSTF